MSTTISNPVTTTPAKSVSRSAAATFESTLRSAGQSLAFSEIAQQALDSFRASKGRFLLTMLGMVIGSASVILVATLGLTGRQFALSQIASIGPNMIEMQYVGGSTPGPDNVSTPDYMTREDMDAVLEQVPGIVASSPMLEDHESLSMPGGITKNAILLGVSPQYKQVRNLKVLAGRFFDDEDASTHAQVAVIVAPLAQALYGSYADAIDKTLSIKGIPFTVIGVFKESIETFGMSEVSDQTLLVPYAVARYFTGTNTVKQIFFTVGDSADVEPASRRISKIITARHRATSVFTAFTLTQVLGVMGVIATMLTVVLTLASAITLVVSGVGIMNSMLANVQSRIREIGIRKALGATRREILMQFLTEAVFLSLSGGFVGTVLGLALPLGIRLFTNIAIPITIWSAVISLSTSVLVGVIFGVLPASRASKLDPVTTLKYE